MKTNKTWIIFPYCVVIKIFGKVMKKLITRRQIERNVTTLYLYSRKQQIDLLTSTALMVPISENH